jgi:predicted DNA-binding transcriptional regulator AlpA
MSNNVTQTNDEGPPQGERLVDLPAILRMIPVGRSTLLAWVRDGVFPPGHKIGPRRRLWKLSDVDRFINKL